MKQQRHSPPTAGARGSVVDRQGRRRHAEEGYAAAHQPLMWDNLGELQAAISSRQRPAAGSRSLPCHLRTQPPLVLLAGRRRVLPAGRRRTLHLSRSIHRHPNDSNYPDDGLPAQLKAGGTWQLLRRVAPTQAH